jgi:arylsulfatase A-like enzyme
MNTTASCSPTRACILTGRNHHSNGVAGIMEIATGFPGYDCRMRPENGMLSEMLRERGYNTFAAGKWHLTPSEECSPAGPFERWPLGRGFDRFYGFLAGETNQWYPDLTEDNHSVAQPYTPAQGYHLDIDLADHSIAFIRDAHVNAPDKPFFLYYAPGACHAPHHAPAEWIERYRGRFDMGWDQARQMIFERQKELGLLAADAQLPPRDPDVPAWETLSADERRLYARFMEVYAAFLSYTDYHFGRVLDTLAELGELDNTIVMVISDNGASCEGGPTGSFNEFFFFNSVPEDFQENLARIDELGGPASYNHYPWGWAWAGDTPFRRWKRETYRGGVSDPFVVSWPAGISARGEIRQQYVHAIDMVPTVLELLGAEPPTVIRGVTQRPLEGISFAYSLADAGAPTRHVTQYFEMLGHRAIDHDGWRAVCPWPGPTFTEAAAQGRRFGDPIPPQVLDELELGGWELYHRAEDPTESHNLAAEHPAKLRELVALWWAEAGKYNVLPIDGSAQARMVVERPQLTAARTRYVYHPGGAPIPMVLAPKVLNRPYSISADVEIPDGGAEGVIYAQGGVTGGIALYVKDNRLHYVHNYVGRSEYRATALTPLKPGAHQLRFEFEPTGEPDLRAGKGTPGRGQLYVDGELVANKDIPVTVPITFGLEGASCGYDFGEAVSHDYEAPFAFTGTLRAVTVDLSGELIVDTEAEIRKVMAQQ